MKQEFLTSFHYVSMFYLENIILIKSVRTRYFPNDSTILQILDKLSLYK